MMRTTTHCIRSCPSEPVHEILKPSVHLARRGRLHQPGWRASNEATAEWASVVQQVGNTPLVRMQRLGVGLCQARNNVILAKLEGNNPAGSVKDRPALSMITEAEKSGVIRPGDTLIEATSGNTGIALAMAAAMKGYKMKLIMPKRMSAERAAAMTAYGAELIGVDQGMEEARDLARAMEARGEGHVLNQFGNADNPLAHLRTTGPELWAQTSGRLTHLVASMGTTGTIMGCSAFLKAMNPAIQIVGLQPDDASQIPGIRKWPPAYLPTIFQSWRVDRVMEMSQRDAECTTRVLARSEGILAGVSSGACIAAALRLSAEVEDAVIAAIVCDRGDRYLSTGIFSPEAGVGDPPAASPATFWSSVQCLVAGFPGPHYVLFTASLEPQTQRPWCTACDGVTDRVKELVARRGGTLLEVFVGDQASWERPDHPLRQQPQLQLRCLPSLMVWHPDGRGPARRAAGDWQVLQGLVNRMPSSGGQGGSPRAGSGSPTSPLRQTAAAGATPERMLPAPQQQLAEAGPALAAGGSTQSGVERAQPARSPTSSPGAGVTMTSSAAQAAAAEAVEVQMNKPQESSSSNRHAGPSFNATETAHDQSTEAASTSTAVPGTLSNDTTPLPGIFAVGAESQPHPPKSVLLTQWSGGWAQTLSQAARKGPIMPP